VTGTTVTLHVGQYLKHGLQSPPVCKGSVEPQFVGETFWERAARALKHVHQIGPYPRSDVLTIFVRTGVTLDARLDVVLTRRGAAIGVVRGDSRFDLAPVHVDSDDDVVAIARKIFAFALPQ